MNATIRPIDPYAVLGVSVTATLSEITTAYRALAQVAHPDKPGGSNELMAQLNEAYDLLADAGGRAHYDASLPAPDDSSLNPIKALVAGKSPQDILRVRGDIAGHVRSLEAGWDAAWAKHPEHIANEKARLARHRRELAYLDGLLA